MTIQKMTEILERAVDEFGETSQQLKAIEELNELSRALVRDFMGIPKAEINVCEEIADVEIMLGQLRLIFGAAEIDDWKDSKLERLERMLGVEIGEEAET